MTAPVMASHEACTDASAPAGRDASAVPVVLPRHYLSASAVVFGRGGRVLVIRRADDGRWATPGGMVEMDESPAEAVVREVREETGLEVRPVALIAVHKNVPQGSVSLVFRCELTGGTEAPQPEEVREVAWLPLAEARARMCEAAFARITDARRAGRTPAVRMHDGTRLTSGWQVPPRRPGRIRMLSALVPGGAA